MKIDQTINGTTNGTYFAKVANDDGTNCQADKAPAGVGAPWNKGSF